MSFGNGNGFGFGIGISTGAASASLLLDDILGAVCLFACLLFHLRARRLDLATGRGPQRAERSGHAHSDEGKLFFSPRR